MTTQEKVWLDVYCAVIGRSKQTEATAKECADNALVSFRRRFPEAVQPKTKGFDDVAIIRTESLLDYIRLISPSTYAQFSKQTGKVPCIAAVWLYFYPQGPESLNNLCTAIDSENYSLQTIAQLQSVISQLTKHLLCMNRVNHG